VCSAVKTMCPDQKGLVVGGHVAALPERTLREEEADFAAAGEGFATLAALVEALQTPVPALSKVPGLVYRDRDQIRINPDAPLASDLDHTVPGQLAWDLLPMHKYR